MYTFAFIIHPLDFEDIYKKYKIARHVSPKLVASLLKRKRPFKISDVTGIESITGSKIRGIFVGVPLLPEQFASLNEDFLVKRVIKGCQVAEELGADIVGLGAFTAMVGDGGRRIAEAVDIAVTTGNTYTVATAIEGTRRAAKLMDIDIRTSTLAVVGASGSIGRTCAEAMAKEVGTIVLVGRDKSRIESVAGMVAERTGVRPLVEDDIDAGIRGADIVITVTGATKSVIPPRSIKPGAVVCDVARPRDVSKEVVRVRKDVLVIEGGIVKVPGNVDFGVNFGCPPGQAMACMSETMILALEGRLEDYTIGKDISLEMVNEMDQLAAKHGFELAGFRSFERSLDLAEIEKIRDNALSQAGSKARSS